MEVVGKLLVRLALLSSVESNGRCACGDRRSTLDAEGAGCEADNEDDADDDGAKEPSGDSGVELKVGCAGGAGTASSRSRAARRRLDSSSPARARASISCSFFFDDSSCDCSATLDESSLFFNCAAAALLPVGAGATDDEIGRVVAGEDADADADRAGRARVGANEGFAVDEAGANRLEVELELEAAAREDCEPDAANMLRSGCSPFSEDDAESEGGA